MARYFLDSSALIKYDHYETGFTEVERILREAHSERLIARLTWVEILSGLAKKRGASGILKGRQRDIVNCDRRLGNLGGSDGSPSYPIPVHNSLCPPRTLADARERLQGRIPPVWPRPGSAPRPQRVAYDRTLRGEIVPAPPFVEFPMVELDRQFLARREIVFQRDGVTLSLSWLPSS
jgi:hypothetical protein